MELHLDPSLRKDIAQGRKLFHELLAGIDKNLPPHMSEVHSEKDIFGQALILAVLRPQSAILISMFTYASHWIDDAFDNMKIGERMGIRLAEWTRVPRDFSATTHRLGVPGQIVRVCAELAARPEEVYRGYRRLFHSALVEHAASKKIRDDLLDEYKNFGIRESSGYVRAFIRGLARKMYYLTNKGVLEIFEAVDPAMDRDATEIWNIIYAPAVLTHDWKKEQGKGELTSMWSVRELAGLVRKGARVVRAHPELFPENRKRQLAVVLDVFGPTLPKMVRNAYLEIQ